MREFTSDISEELAASCQAGSEEAAGAVARAFDGDFALETGSAQPLDENALPSDLAAEGLAIEFRVGSASALVLLPASCGFLPAWCSAPDESGASRLATLAQELGVVLLPDEFVPDSSRAVWVADLAATLKQCQPAEAAWHLALAFSSGEQRGDAALVWPLHQQMPTSGSAEEAVPSADSNQQAAEAQGTKAAEATPGSPTSLPDSTPDAPQKQRLTANNLDEGILQLPPYARSLLKVQVPVTVTLASTKQAVEQILELGPGSIIQFSKSCDDNLTLEIGNQTIAEGEAVKVGDKFGLWITAMTMPEERFWKISSEGSGVRVK